MSFVRARALRSLQQGLKRPIARIPAQSRTQLGARRYASGGGGHGEPSSDLPWLISALAVTPVGAYFLWPSASSSHGHGDHHDEHAEEHEEPEEEPEDTPSGAPDSKAESNQEEDAKTEDSSDDSNNDTDEENEKKKESPETAKPTGTEGDSQPKASDANKKSSGTEGSSEPTSKGGKPQTEGVTFKGKMKEDSPGMQQTSKREPDSKGGYKNRLDSGLQKDLTPSTETHDENGRELANTSKPKSDQPGDISNKQAGMSNTPTRHSIPIHEMADKSKKGEGAPETAKSMGTVDPSRPMAESDDRGKRQ